MIEEHVKKCQNQDYPYKSENIRRWNISLWADPGSDSCRIFKDETGNILPMV